MICMTHTDNKLPRWGSWHREAMTERARTLTKAQNEGLEES